MWQEVYEELGDESFTVVGIALDAEGIEPAKNYYNRFGVKFPSLVDPDYATGFGAVPKTFFVDEHGVVQGLSDWQDRLATMGPIRPVSEVIRRQWSVPGARLDSASIARLAFEHLKSPRDLATATQLASRYLALGLAKQAKAVLQTSVAYHQPREIARAGGERARLLGQAYFQLSRASEGMRDEQVHHATLSFYLSPSVGFGKQIARIIAPEKFDGRPGGDFDNRFREATLQRLRRERITWLDE